MMSWILFGKERKGSKVIWTQNGGFDDGLKMGKYGM
jgi:hypothetical protein